MSHKYDVIGSGNCQNRILRPNFSRSEYFVGILLKFAYSGAILNAIQHYRIGGNVIFRNDQTLSYFTSNDHFKNDNLWSMTVLWTLFKALDQAGLFDENDYSVARFDKAGKNEINRCVKYRKNFNKFSWCQIVICNKTWIRASCWNFFQEMKKVSWLLKQLTMDLRWTGCLKTISLFATMKWTVRQMLMQFITCKAIWLPHVPSL